MLHRFRRQGAREQYGYNEVTYQHYVQFECEIAIQMIFICLMFYMHLSKNLFLSTGCFERSREEAEPPRCKFHSDLSLVNDQI